MHIELVPSLTVVHIATHTYTILGGAGGWIDTDCSGEIGATPKTGRLYIFQIRAGAAQYVGARKHGSAVGCQSIAQDSLLLTESDGVGHIDFYREAADAYYSLVGYIDVL